VLLPYPPRHLDLGSSLSRLQSGPHISAHIFSSLLNQVDASPIQKLRRL
jgi:hypothetical protein